MKLSRGRRIRLVLAVVRYDSGSLAGARVRPNMPHHAIRMSVNLAVGTLLFNSRKGSGHLPYSPSGIGLSRQRKWRNSDSGESTFLSAPGTIIARQIPNVGCFSYHNPGLALRFLDSVLTDPSSAAIRIPRCQSKIPSGLNPSGHNMSHRSHLTTQVVRSGAILFAMPERLIPSSAGWFSSAVPRAEPTADHFNCYYAFSIYHRICSERLPRRRGWARTRLTTAGAAVQCAS